MKNAEQFSADMTSDEALRSKFREGINKLRGDRTLSIAEASLQVARELGYDISDEEVKKFMARMQAPMRELTDSELEKVAGGKQYCEYVFDCW